MSLRDIVSHADLAVFPEIGLVLFMLAFAGVVYRVMRAGDSLDPLAELPLEDGPLVEEVA